MIRKKSQEHNLRTHYLDQKGSALIVTLLLVTILVTLVSEFVYSTYIDSSTLFNWSNAQKASLLAKSGQNLSVEFISEINSDTYSYEKSVDLPVEYDLEKNASLLITIEDDNAKLNINSIIYPNGVTNEKSLSSLKKLLEFLNINPDLSLIIADWIDPDKEPRLSNSEDNAKNTFVWCVDELKHIEGVNDSVFAALKPYVTVHGNNQININSAELPVLTSLHTDMTENLARNIIDYRESAPFENKNYIVRVSGLETIGIQILDRITVKASSFRITSRATVNEITREVESVIDSDMKVHFWREG